MKKALFFITICIFPIIIKGACDYKEQIDLNTLSSNIKYSYDYDETKKAFTLTFFNVTEEMYLQKDSKIFKTTNTNEVVLSSLEEGETFNIKVFASSNTGCYGTYLRDIPVSLPYLNPYYNHAKCSGKMEYTVCNSQFLSYKLSYKSFVKTIEKIEETQKSNTNNKNEKSEKLFSELFSLVKNNYIIIIVVISSTILSFLIWKLIYRKIIHKL